MFNSIVPPGPLHFWIHTHKRTTVGHYSETAQPDHPVTEEYHAHITSDTEHDIFDDGNSHVDHREEFKYAPLGELPSLSRPLKTDETRIANHYKQWDRQWEP